MILAWLAGCTFEPVEEQLTIDPEPIPVRQLWDGLPGEGTTVTVIDLVISSPRTVDGTAFYAQDIDGGPRSGLRVELSGTVTDWPPPVGTPVTLVGTFDARGDGPALALDDDASEVVGDTLVEPVVVPHSVDRLLEQALVRLDDIEVTSAVDPLGQADTDGAAGVGGMFGVGGPGWGRTGDLSGVFLDGRVSPRSADDFTGVLPGDAPLVVGLHDLEDLPRGTPVRVHDLLAATPLSRDGRWLVVQDRAGRGVWVDGEAWGLQHHVDEGDVGIWVGEVRDDDGTVLRVWQPPIPDGPGGLQPLETTEITDGAMVRLEVDALEPVGDDGDRVAGALTLDDRFLPLDDLQPGDEVLGAARGDDRVAPVSWR